MKIGFIGMGTMGAPMASRLVEAGHNLTVHNRTQLREEPLIKLGATRGNSPKEAVVDVDLVITMVSDTPDVESVILGPDGAIHGMRKGTVLMDMSTISPAATRRFAKALQQKDIEMLDAPVSGGSEGAHNGTLSIMVGGNSQLLDLLKPVLEVLGSTITHVGPIGSGQIAKAINQVIIAGTYAAVAEGMVLGLAAGLDIKAAHTAVSGGAASSWVLSNRASNMINNDYPLGFRTRLHRKDLGIALDAARDLGVPLPISAFVEQIETGLLKKGYGEEDVSNIARYFREQAAID
jgi:3-hydroxyisobutyrate dehydrogenase